MQYDIAFFGTSLTWLNYFEPMLLNKLQASTGRFIRGYNMGENGEDSGQGVVRVSQAVTPRPWIATVEFSMNDCATNRGISRVQAVSNNATIINALKTAIPASRIFLMTMNPVINVGGDSAIRTGITNYYQDIRDLSVSLGVGLIDNYAAWVSFGANATHIPDGIHPLRQYVEAVTVPTMQASLAPLLP